MNFDFATLPTTDVKLLRLDTLSAERVRIDPCDFRALSAESTAYAQPRWEQRPIITKRKDLANATRTLLAKAVVAVDTETDIAPEKKAAARKAGLEPAGDRSARLCLVQLGYAEQTLIPQSAQQPERIMFAGNGKGASYLASITQLTEERAATAAALGKDTTNPLQPLKQLLEDPEILKIAHNASFEVRQFKKYGIQIGPLEDTMRLARQFRPDLPAFNLAACALELCGIALDKEEQKGDWDQFPLSEAQERYARLDVEITIAVWETIKRYEARALKEIAEVVASDKAEAYIEALRQLEWDRQRLLEQSGLLELECRLRAESARYEAFCKKELLPRFHAELMAVKGSAFDSSEGYQYTGACGSAIYRPRPLRELDVEGLRAVDPSLPDDVLRPKATKETVAAAIAALRAENPSLNLTLDDVWNAIRCKKSLGEPKLSVRLASLPRGPDFDELYSKVETPAAWGVGEYLQAIMEAKLTRARLLRISGLGNELGLIELKKRMLSDSLLEKLIETERAKGAPELPRKSSITCQAGQAEYSISLNTETDYAKFRSLYPELYEKAIRLVTSQDGVDQALKARGFDPAAREMLLEDLFVWKGKFGNLEARLYPAFGRYYKGIEDPADAIERDSFS